MTIPKQPFSFTKHPFEGSPNVFVDTLDLIRQWYLHPDYMQLKTKDCPRIEVDLFLEMVAKLYKSLYFWTTPAELKYIISVLCRFVVLYGEFIPYNTLRSLRDIIEDITTDVDNIQEDLSSAESLLGHISRLMESNRKK